MKMNKRGWKNGNKEEKRVLLKPGLYIVVTIAEYVCDDAPKRIFKAVNISIASISCEKSILVIITIWRHCGRLKKHVRLQSLQLTWGPGFIPTGSGLTIKSYS